MMSASSLLLTAFSQTCSAGPYKCPEQAADQRLPVGNQTSLPLLSTTGHLHLLQRVHLISAGSHCLP